jgi:hypothetical protein
MQDKKGATGEQRRPSLSQTIKLNSQRPRQAGSGADLRMDTTCEKIACTTRFAAKSEMPMAFFGEFARRLAQSTELSLRLLGYGPLRSPRVHQRFSGGSIPASHARQP